MNYIIFFLSIMCYSQVNRFVYKIDYKRDSTIEKYNKTQAILEVSKSELSFYEYSSYKLDSINIKEKSNSKTIPPLNININRKIGSYINNNYVFVSSSYFYYESNDKITWTLHEDKKAFGQFNLQKATARYGGRNWVAWFTEEIPISEGPYKFSGLPGLIFEIYDDKENYKFTLLEMYQIKDKNEIWIPSKIYGMKSVQISHNKYNTLLLIDYNNPFQEFRSMTGDWTLAAYGKTIKTVEGLNEIRNIHQQIIKKNYNPIELDKAVLYK